MTGIKTLLLSTLALTTVVGTVPTTEAFEQAQGDVIMTVLPVSPYTMEVAAFTLGMGYTLAGGEIN